MKIYHLDIGLIQTIFFLINEPEINQMLKLKEINFFD